MNHIHLNPAMTASSGRVHDFHYTQFLLNNLSNGYPHLLKFLKNPKKLKLQQQRKKKRKKQKKTKKTKTKKKKKKKILESPKILAFHSEIA